MPDFESYYPVPAPENIRQLPRYVNDELRRVSELKEPRRARSLFAIGWTDTILIVDATVPTWQRLTDPTDTPDYVFPEDMWNQAAGTIIAPNDGFYKVNVIINTLDVGGSGNRNYYVAAAVERNWTSGAPSTFVRNQKANNLDMILAGNGIEFFNAGDTIDILAAAWADQFTITSDIHAWIEVNREV